MKTTSSKVYYVTLEPIYAFWDIPEHDLKEGWTFYLVSKLYQVGDIT